MGPWFAKNPPGASEDAADNITVTWSIEKLERKTLGDLKDYISAAHFKVTAQCEEIEDVLRSNARFPLNPEVTHFTPLDDLSQEQIIDWVKSTLGELYVRAAEDSVRNTVYNKINPPIVGDDLPWAKKPTLDAGIEA